MLNKRNVVKYYPDTTKTPKGHLNQTRKNVRSTKPKTPAFGKTDTTTLRVYDIINTVFPDHTGQFPTRSKQSNKYIMVMVEINSNAILVEPIKDRTDE